MEEDIEKLIESFVVPEMEYVKTKRGADDKTVDVPEVVLPKTRAEVYEEAKGRLGQKTSAVSRRGAAKSERTKTRGRSDGGAALKTKTPRKSRERADVPEVVLPGVAATVTPNACDEPRTRERVNALRRASDAPKWVGDSNELVPFAWRNPLVDVAKPSRLYKLTMREARERALLLPVPHSKPNA